jgi:hypothetical protein
MNTPAFSHEELVRRAKLSPTDLENILECRQAHTCLGFAYQLAFVRLNHRFPAQQPLEIVAELLTYVSLQLDLPSVTIQTYQQQRRTLINHQQEIRTYLNLRPFGESEIALLNVFLLLARQTDGMALEKKWLMEYPRCLYTAARRSSGDSHEPIGDDDSAD